ncbi:hypothetical protein BS78_05G226400 [Paspalum vaginatum]|nr:hypothetical protein BS78_05G226400 [Paspalum vaginatum]
MFPFFQPSPPPAQHAAVVLPRHAVMAQPVPPGLHIRQVTAANYDAELDDIGSLLPGYPYIAVDTEYPGVVHRPPTDPEKRLIPPERYALVKANVDDVPIVQLGITLCNELGDAPVVHDSNGHPHEIAWEVTFSDFDARRDPHAPESVAFLRSRGLDFDQARAGGVSSAAFADKLAAVLSSAAPWREGELTWAAFGGAYDFGYLTKMLAGGRPLPETWHEFMGKATALLGGRVFDAKFMAENGESTDLSGGLRHVADILAVPRLFPARPFLAGRKSHTAGRIYTAMRRRVLYMDGGASFNCRLDGLH